ncbi:DUF4382 domain-containing protein [Vibrio hannami]|uniref:DUF4382 domain-containing protein n=1 Tax=Vibrio hannami TaxID=2717094 RepID=UPI00240ECAAA|nr:DUF4382 domain-containing protein [Vibrio hannami]MDG3085033.1 DUF4382 domain-containing protein [Vibrio hannami]
MKTQLATISSAVLLLAGCNSGSDNNKTASVSFYVSDAPVEEAEEVVVAFDALELIHESGQRYQLNVVDTDESQDYQQIDLLEYQGSDSKLILSDEPILTGTYRELIVHIKPESYLNWVTNNGVHDLKVPSNKLKLGGFEVTTDSVQSFTIEFDLRKSLVLRGNDWNNNGYNLKPHGVKIVDNRSAASLRGNIEPSLFYQGSSCSEDGGNVVYLYQGHGHNGNTLIDNFDPTDADYDDNIELPENYVEPYASVEAEENGDYQFGFIPAGNYTVAFTCSAYEDDPVQYDQIEIANPSDQVSEVILEPTKEHNLDFPVVP